MSGDSQQISSIDNVNHMILYYKGLNSAQRISIDKCGLNLESAIKRCENVHGSGKCAKITTTFVNRKCPDNFRIEGCCQCVINCPDGWKDDGYWCHKPAAITLSKFTTQSECAKSGKNCVSINNEFFTEVCPTRFERVGQTLCLPKCPLGWNDQGWRCMKPATHHVGHPFIWVAGDN